ncbi:MAG: bifunctional (p)ppGpp synthetase/guanosine-3',5'-bis(diphosphate) 3'-pyrophosphohydrolase [Blastocatellia bacterium]|nr:bifunctional (p)ppGpp synthetase/guanosine-3',5'-bis(diphosphate) 3'-pyrophosphohydrolase [Blastocatellia bacterium]
MIRFEDILEKVERYHPNADLDLLRRAYLFSAKMHKGQVRKSGEPYLAHPIEVANILADMKLDEICISTGLLHDVVEDTHVTLEELEAQFGKEISGLVDGLTKISQIEHANREERQAETVRKMLLAMVGDIRVILVKLADRLHNMRTMDFLPPEKRAIKSQETLDIYAPMAHRLGMGKIRGELEDLSFKYLYPDDYLQLKNVIDKRREKLEALLEEVKQGITTHMAESGIHIVRIEGRIKRLYSLFMKLKRQGIPFDQVYDLMAVRVITETLPDCYAALGVIHNMWKPVPGRFKDWIAIPRNNLYQSLHTSVVSENGQAFEIQIRTAEMHKIAEEGIAAHWKYKEGKSGVQQRDDEMYLWLKRLVEWQQEVSDSREFLDDLKANLYPQDVYAFTPKGKILELPRGATPIDFAYAIHSDVGQCCVGARVNGHIVKLSYQLKNGDVVEILTSPNARPSRDWLKIVQTGKARNRIRKYLAESERHRALEIGRKLLDREAERFKLNVKKELSDMELQRVAPDYGFQRAEDIISAIGYGKIEARTVIAKIIPQAKLEEADGASKNETGSLAQVGKFIRKVMRLGKDRIQVRGTDDIMVFRARCCNPIRGEKIIGYITRGKGVAVHRATCANAKNLMINRERMVDVEWVEEDTMSSSYAVNLSVVTENRQGMLADLTTAISNIKTDIRDAHASVTDDGRGRIDITAEVYDLKHLERVMRAVRSVSGVVAVERTTEN